MLARAKQVGIFLLMLWMAWLTVYVHNHEALFSKAQQQTGNRLGALITTNWSGDLDGSTYANQIVTGLEGHGVPPPGVGALQYDGGGYYWGAAGVLPPIPVNDLDAGTAGTFLVQNASNITQWSTLDTFDTTYGRVIAGGTGSNAKAALGPMVSAETADGALYLLPNGVNPTSGNPAMYSAGQNLEINAPTAGYYIRFRTGGGGVDGEITDTGWVIGNAAITAANLVQGSMALTIRAITGTDTVDATTKDYYLAIDTTGGAFAETLPTPTAGRTLVLVDTKNNFATANLTLTRHGSEKIDGVAASKVYSANSTRAHILSDGTDWYTY